MSGKYENYIGVFDSGVGGISVLEDIAALMPGENYIYFGDSANAPYGMRTVEEVQQLTDRAIGNLVREGVKAVVIACNTATSAAAPMLREKYSSIPVIGVEPALKPAVEAGHKHILVMATKVTLQLEKFHRLAERFGSEAEVIPLPGIGLVEEIEKGDFESPKLREVLAGLLAPYVGKVDAVVLGCTHFPFIRKQIREVLGDVPMFDGGVGTAREVMRKLREKGCLAEGAEKGEIIFASSKDTEEERELYRRFFTFPVR